MALSPLDIESRSFRREPLGYSRREVDERLRAAADALSQVILERDDLSRMLQAVRHELDEYRTREKTLIEALAAAERLTEERKAVARQQAESLIAEARHKAETIVNETRQQAEVLLARTRADAARMEQSTVRLKVERDNFETRLFALLDEYRRLLETHRAAENQRIAASAAAVHGPSSGQAHGPTPPLDARPRASAAAAAALVPGAGMPAGGSIVGPPATAAPQARPVAPEIRSTLPPPLVPMSPHDPHE